MRIIPIALLSLFLISCASTQPQVVYKTEYQEVKVPVVYSIDRPKRPLYTSGDTAPSYLLKLRQYTITLETIIDKTKE